MFKKDSLVNAALNILIKHLLKKKKKKTFKKKLAELSQALTSQPLSPSTMIDLPGYVPREGTTHLVTSSQTASKNHNKNDLCSRGCI